MNIEDPAVLYKYYLTWYGSVKYYRELKQEASFIGNVYKRSMITYSRAIAILQIIKQINIGKYNL